jgi:peptidyl-prolyl cis-trans isomerase C/peptidyl-prolyl cis-trans isomerase SurA
VGSNISEDEELDKEKLDDMKDAFDDLEIIDVERKPEILISSLRKGSEFVDANNIQELQSSANSLIQKGFRPVSELDKDGKPLSYPNRKPKLKVVSQKGEVLVGMKDGVEYVLRFGETYRGPEDDENSTGDSRYIYAYARVNENLLEQPVLEPVPAPLVEHISDENSSSVPPTTPDSNGSKGDNGDQGQEGKPSVPPIAPPGPPPSFIPPSPPPSLTPPPPPSAEEINSQETNSSAPSNGEDNFAKEKADRDAEIARIKASNAQKQMEYQGKVTKAQARVNELNENLAGWYYVISNEVYEKIRLDRSDFVKAKEKEESDKPEEVQASHILISYKGADRADADISRSKEEAKAEAERIRKLIVDDGKDFAEMAKKHSDGPSSTKGGDLGKFKFEVMAKSFSEAAFALGINEVSEVVETGFGYHVIKRTN